MRSGDSSDGRISDPPADQMDEADPCTLPAAKWFGRRAPPVPETRWAGQGPLS